MARQLDGLALGAIAAGSLFTYAGIKGYSVPHAIQALVKGQKPSAGGQANPITSTTAFLGTPGVQSSALPSAGTYTHAQLVTLWQQAGGSAGTADNAACHAIQESGGNPQATSPNPDGGTNAGLWQLDTPGGVGAGYSVTELQNAMNNARITVMATRNGTDWSEWATPGC
ncbi:MAG: hypothetical protein ACRDPY_33630 [Streptosporangiaceae bacterium]